MPMPNTKLPLEERKRVPVQTHVPISLYRDVEHAADCDGVRVAEVVRRALVDYVKPKATR